MDTKSEIRRFYATFVSNYGNAKKHVNFLIHKTNPDYVWASLCEALNQRYNFTIDYAKHFWHLDSSYYAPVCIGCEYSAQNQLGHMVTNGCLSNDRSDPATVDSDNEKKLLKYQ